MSFVETVVTKGLVIKQTNYGEADRILHIFTEDFGIVSAVAKGARKYKSHQGGAAQLLYFSSFTLAGGRDMYSLRGANTIESFFALSESLEKLALCTYLFDITKAFVPEGVPDRKILSLLLNTLYVLCTKPQPLPLVKAAYELKLLEFSGYMPSYDRCCICSKQDGNSCFSLLHGGTVCKNCAQNADMPVLLPAAYMAMKYILENDISKIFSFTISSEGEKNLSDICERFLQSCAERDFLSLSYYKSVCEI